MAEISSEWHVHSLTRDMWSALFNVATGHDSSIRINLRSISTTTPPQKPTAQS